MSFDPTLQEKTHTHADQNRVSGKAAIDQCLKTIMALTSEDLSHPERRLALIAMRDTINTLLARYCEPKAEQNVESHGHGESLDEPQTSWRSKKKNQSEKDQKRARLEKREEILRELRSRITNFKTESTQPATPEEQHEASEKLQVGIDAFEMRRQRASFWPQGSVEWARQLLGVELWMTPTERRQCYIDMVKACHPDHNHSVATDAIQLVNAAWDVLR
ncbi:hypothetical protein EBU99_11560 [bacterium]|nr:hypothetical protein [bacterium]